MKVGLASIAYREERFIKPFLQHIPSWVGTRLVLGSTKPWQGQQDPPDATFDIAHGLGADVIEWAWPSEHEQRNAGQMYLQDCDWIIVLDPDEFLSKSGWKALKQFIDSSEAKQAKAFVVGEQYTYWKAGYRISPPEDYKQIILVRPDVKFIDKRVVDVGYSHIPLRLHHMSWARTDAEVKSKITHYAHAHEIDPTWYDRVWKAWTPSMRDLHPKSPEALQQAIPATLPADLNKLGIWPPIDEVVGV